MQYAEFFFIRMSKNVYCQWKAEGSQVFCSPGWLGGRKQRVYLFLTTPMQHHTWQVWGFHDIDKTELITKVWSRGGKDKIRDKGHLLRWFCWWKLTFQFVTETPLRDKVEKRKLRKLHWMFIPASILGFNLFTRPVLWSFVGDFQWFSCVTRGDGFSLILRGK